MQNHPLNSRSSYEVQEMIDRLEMLRCGLDYGELRYALETAIECMEYLSDASKIPAPIMETEVPKNRPHWIISRNGFAGELYTCSSCGESYWDPPQKYIGSCRVCHTVMDLSANEYEM